MKNSIEYLNPNDNLMLSSLSGDDLQEIVNILNSYKLEYRDFLNLDSDITFGIEIECEQIKEIINKRKIEDLNPYYDWNCSYDGSLIKGIEVKSPILMDNVKSWIDIYKVCSYLATKSNVLDEAAAHVHVGAHILKEDNTFWVNFLKLYSTYENILFRFGYGEDLINRKHLKDYAKPISRSLWERAGLIEKYNFDYKQIVDLLKSNRTKYTSVNFNNLINRKNVYAKYNTIEFRFANGTLNHIIWQNNVNLFCHLLTYSLNPNFNNEIINERHKQIANDLENLHLYNEIYLDQSLELADLIFDNNLDKIYFLRQYLKNYELSNKRNEAKPFTKILTK